MALAASAMPRALFNLTTWRLIDPKQTINYTFTKWNSEIGNDYGLPIKPITLSLAFILEHWQLAQKRAEMCIRMRAFTVMGLPPENFKVNAQATNSSTFIKEVGGGYLLDAQLAESLFVLWRLTGEERYREEAWKLSQALGHARSEKGPGIFSIRSVNSKSPLNEEELTFLEQRPHFISATLKYLYLTFSPVDLFPLDKWVFDSYGHPLPICGQHERYQIVKSKCTFIH